jgi:hypothetical protein
MAIGGARPYVRHQALVQHLFDSPEIGSLPHEGTPITQSGKPRRPMPLEIAPDRRVAIVAQQLPDKLQGDHFLIAQTGSNSSGTQFHAGRHVCKHGFHPTKHGDDKLFQRHG